MHRMLAAAWVDGEDEGSYYTLTIEDGDLIDRFYSSEEDEEPDQRPIIDELAADTAVAYIYDPGYFEGPSKV
jgi:hypothetical protein